MSEAAYATANGLKAALASRAEEFVQMVVAEWPQARA